MTTFILLSNGWVNTGTNHANWWAVSPESTEQFGPEKSSLRGDILKMFHIRSETLWRFYFYKAPCWHKTTVTKSALCLLTI